MLKQTKSAKLQSQTQIPKCVRVCLGAQDCAGIPPPPQPPIIPPSEPEKELQQVLHKLVKRLKLKTPLRNAMYLRKWKYQRVSPEFLTLLLEHQVGALPRRYLLREPNFSYYKYDGALKFRHMRVGIDTAAPLQFPCCHAQCPRVGHTSEEINDMKLHEFGCCVPLEKPIEEPKPKEPRRSVDNGPESYEYDKGMLMQTKRDLTDEQKQRLNYIYEENEYRANENAGEDPENRLHLIYRVQENYEDNKLLDAEIKAEENKNKLHVIYQPSELEPEPREEEKAAKPKLHVIYEPSRKIPEPRKTPETKIIPAAEDKTDYCPQPKPVKSQLQPHERWICPKIKAGKKRDPRYLYYENTPFYQVLKNNSYLKETRTPRRRSRSRSRHEGKGKSTPVRTAPMELKSDEQLTPKTSEHIVRAKSKKPTHGFYDVLRCHRKVFVHGSERPDVLDDTDIEARGRSTSECSGFRSYVKRSEKDLIEHYYRTHCHLVTKDAYKVKKRKKPKPYCYLWSTVDDDIRLAEKERLAELACRRRKMNQRLNRRPYCYLWSDVEPDIKANTKQMLEERGAEDRAKALHRKKMRLRSCFLWSRNEEREAEKERQRIDRATRLRLERWRRKKAEESGTSIEEKLDHPQQRMCYLWSTPDKDHENKPLPQFAANPNQRQSAPERHSSSSEDSETKKSKLEPYYLWSNPGDESLKERRKRKPAKTGKEVKQKEVVKCVRSVRIDESPAKKEYDNSLPCARFTSPESTSEPETTEKRYEISEQDTCCKRLAPNGEGNQERQNWSRPVERRSQFGPIPSRSNGTILKTPNIFSQLIIGKTKSLSIRQNDGSDRKADWSFPMDHDEEKADKNKKFMWSAPVQENTHLESKMSATSSHQISRRESKTSQKKKRWSQFTNFSRRESRASKKDNQSETVSKRDSMVSQITFRSEDSDELESNSAKKSAPSENTTNPESTVAKTVYSEPAAKRESMVAKKKADKADKAAKRDSIFTRKRTYSENTANPESTVAKTVYSEPAAKKKADKAAKRESTFTRKSTYSESTGNRDSTVSQISIYSENSAKRDSHDTNKNQQKSKSPRLSREASTTSMATHSTNEDHKKDQLPVHELAKPLRKHHKVEEPPHQDYKEEDRWHQVWASKEPPVDWEEHRPQRKHTVIQKENKPVQKKREVHMWSAPIEPSNFEEMNKKMKCTSPDRDCDSTKCSLRHYGPTPTQHRTNSYLKKRPPSKFHSHCSQAHQGAQPAPQKRHTSAPFIKSRYRTLSKERLPSKYHHHCSSTEKLTTPKPRRRLVARRSSVSSSGFVTPPTEPLSTPCLDAERRETNAQREWEKRYEEKKKAKQAGLLPVSKRGNDWLFTSRAIRSNESLRKKSKDPGMFVRRSTIFPIDKKKKDKKNHWFFVEESKNRDRRRRQDWLVVRPSGMDPDEYLDQDESHKINTLYLQKSEKPSSSESEDSCGCFEEGCTKCSSLPAPEPVYVNCQVSQASRTRSRGIDEHNSFGDGDSERSADSGNYVRSRYRAGLEDTRKRSGILKTHSFADSLAHQQVPTKRVHYRADTKKPDLHCHAFCF
ncbi:uncharacterized protein LOC115625311 [Scaptodrosophila lebanonensis]|uniref:Uncharacterized protein LOC115625311 n=1 Tax=Drosophila lebanonensis TaxID=7225 RepID=A0A6J2TJK6_DROLE|nr:uncharacterized protein LOC115625311 [Scaptodrosophila lebanonensis]